MGAFEYVALDTKGREQKGVLEGDTLRQIRQSLREQGLVPLVVEEVHQKETRAGNQPLFRRRISVTDLSLITRQLATLVQSGLPVEESLKAVAKQTTKPRIKSMLVAVRSKVMEGHPLATAMGDFPNIFNELFRATVSAGEQSGYLNVVLERLADYTESRQQMTQKMQLALIYPVLLSIVAVGVVVGLLTYVVPQVIQVFENVGQDLPVLTIGLIAVSDFLKSYALILFVIIAAAVGIFNYLIRFEGPRYQYHSLLLKIPLIARLTRGLNTARFARTFSILTASGVPVLDGMRISSQVISNRPMRAAVEQAARRVREGSSLHNALETSGYFPPLTLQLIASGEASGKLEQMLERAAISQEGELDTLRGALLGILEPMIIVVMGFIIGVIVLAILLPILNLNQLVQ